MKLRAWLGIGAALTALALGACSSSAHDPSDSAEAGSASSSRAPVSRWLAVARGQVDVEGGMVQVVSLAPGVVASVDVEQGEHVKKGQVLARLDARATRIGVATARVDVSQAEAKLAELEASLTQADWSARHLGAAAKAGAATGAAAVEAKATAASMKAKRAAAQAGLEATRQQLARAQLELDETTLRAPVAGTVVTRHVAIGQAVSAAAGAALFQLLPDRPYIVRAQVDAQAATHLRPGMHAEIIRDSGAGPVYSATVVSIGKVLQAATLAPSPLERALANDVDCILKLAPPMAGETPLPVGQRVDVKFPRQQ